MKRVVIGVIGNDIHVVAIKLLEIALLERGYKVFNLGVNTKPEEFVDAVIETNADLLLISSINGEAANWVYNIKRKLEDKNFLNVLLAIGGNLSLGEREEDEIVAKFKSFGFDFVFYQKGIEESLNQIEVQLSR